MGRFKRIKEFTTCSSDNKEEDGERSNQEDDFSSSHEAKFNILDVPTCILLEILVRLPLKSILICSCMSKTSWKIIRESYFHDAYQKMQHSAIVLYSRMSIANPPYLLEIGDHCELIRIPIRANTPPHNGFLHLLGSCNGLICVAESSFENNLVCTIIHICNPILGEYVSLPEFHKSEVPVAYGFGFDPSSNHYKVVRFVDNLNTIYASDIKTCEVFTVGVDVKWRTLEHETCQNRLGFQGPIFQGAIHWMPEQEQYQNPRRCFDFIYAFDIREEKLRSISTPPGMERGKKASYKLLVLKDFLSIFSFLDPDKLHIWTMREYGVVESWSRKYSVREGCLSGCNIINVLPSPVKIWGDGEIIILSRQTGLISYSLRDKEYTELQTNGMKKFSSVCIYFPSLIPLKNLFSGGQVKVLSTR